MYQTSIDKSLHKSYLMQIVKHWARFVSKAIMNIIAFYLFISLNLEFIR